MGAPTSAVLFTDARTRRTVRALDQASILATSRDLGWDGVLAEVGHNGAWEVEGLSVPHHYLSINLAPEPLAFEAVVEGRVRPVVMPPGAMWFCPAGEPFTHRVASESRYGVVTLDPARLAALSGRHGVRLARRYAIEDAQLGHLVRALLLEAERGGPLGPMFADALASALAIHLAAHGPDPGEAAVGGGTIPPRRLRALLDLIDARLETGLTLAEMAERVGLSPYHFAREFKRATGLPPHRYLVSRRLDRARTLLRADAGSIATIAADLGFADQSHLTRLFKREFGVTPRAFLDRGR